MNELFGIPVEGLLVVLLVAIGVAAGILVILALRNPILVRLGIRNAGRRRGRTALIVLGLMLGTTIVAAALTTGDTMSHTIRQTAVEALGETDVVVSAKGATADIPGELGAATGTGYFDQKVAEQIRAALEPTELVDGVVPAIVEEVALQAPAQRQNEPGVNLFAPDPAQMNGFGVIERVGGGTVSLADLRPGEVFLSRKAADDLGVVAGARILIFAGGSPAPVRVRDVVDYKGAGTADAALLLPLGRAQQLLDKEGLIKHVLVSNRGSGTSAVALSDQVVAALDPFQATLGVEAVPMKQDAHRVGRRSGERLHGVLHHVRVILDCSGHPPCLPHLRDARCRAPRRARDRPRDRYAPRTRRPDVRLRGAWLRPRRRAGREPFSAQRSPTAWSS